MPQYYTDPKRANDRYSLPDLEIWADRITIIRCARCGDFDTAHDSAHADTVAYCPSCEREAEIAEDTDHIGWFYWFCLPGCMPDSCLYGPFETKDKALNDAREAAGVEED